MLSVFCFPWHFSAYFQWPVIMAPPFALLWTLLHWQNVFKFLLWTGYAVFEPTWISAHYTGTLTILMGYKALGICIFSNTELFNLELSCTVCMDWKCVLLCLLSASNSASAKGSPGTFPPKNNKPQFVGIISQLSAHKPHYSYLFWVLAQMHLQPEYSSPSACHWFLFGRCQADP